VRPSQDFWRIGDKTLATVTAIISAARWRYPEEFSDKQVLVNELYREMEALPKKKGDLYT
jgi:hypothetical protein